MGYKYLGLWNHATGTLEDCFAPFERHSVFLRSNTFNNGSGIIVFCPRPVKQKHSFFDPDFPSHLATQQKLSESMTMDID